MNKRNIQVLVRLNKEENEHLKKQVKKSGLSGQAYLRHLIAGAVPREVPPPEYFMFMRELHNVGNNLNQIVQKAHVLNVQRYNDTCRKLDRLIRDVTEAVILPAKRV